MTYTASDITRFWQKVQRGGECWEWKAGTYDDGYGCFWAGGRNHRAHRVAYTLVHGEIPEGLLLDHKCFNHRCVNPEHLRPASAKQNGEHRAGAQGNSKSGVRGVQFRPARNTYSATVVHNRKRHWVGTYKTLHEAERAVRETRLSLFTHNDVDRHGATQTV